MNKNQKGFIPIAIIAIAAVIASGVASGGWLIAKHVLPELTKADEFQNQEMKGDFKRVEPIRPGESGGQIKPDQKMEPINNEKMMPAKDMKTERGIVPEQRMDKEAGFVPEKRMEPNEGNKPQETVKTTEMKQERQEMNNQDQKMDLNEEENSQQDIVDPREIKDALRQITDIKREAKRLKTQGKKVAGIAEELAKIDEILSTIDKYGANIKQPPSDMTQREAMQEFWDLQIWDAMNAIRAKIEFPTQMKNVEKELTKVEKMLKQKTYQKIANLNMDLIKTVLSDMKKEVEAAKAEYAAGNIEDAMETLNSLFNDAHPGDINCTLNSFRDFNQNFKRVKDPEIKATIQEILDPIIESANSGDYREACQGFNEIRNELWKVMQFAFQVRKTITPQMEEKIQKLQDLIGKKYEKDGVEGENFK